MKLEKKEYPGLLVLYFLAIAWTWWAGKDINWDLINYHFYGPSLLLENRWSKDYFAASIQSYLNPIAYIPFFWMVKGEWNDFLIAVILASFHFISVILSWMLAKKVARPEGGGAVVIPLLAAAAALACPLLLLLMGSTFSDPITAPLILSSFLVVISRNRSNIYLGLAAGALVGVATGIKLTNGVFAIGLIAALVSRQFSAAQDLKGAIHSVFGAVIGLVSCFALAHGYWSWKLWSEFGNPFFPFFNAIFQSSDYPSINIHDRRFMGTGFWGIFTLPFDMARSETWVYNEAATPDIRIAALTLVMVAAIPFLGIRCSRKNIQGRWIENLLVVTVFFIVSYFAWAASSRIGRYGLPLWILAGPLFVAWLAVIFSLRHVIAFACGVLAVQAYVTYVNDVSRWTPTTWSGKWFDFSIPEDIRHKRATFITIDAQSFSAIAPFLSSDSSFSNVIGMYTMPIGKDLPGRLEKIIDEKSVYLIYMAGLTKGDAAASVSDGRWISIGEKIASYGFVVNRDACEEGSLRLDSLPRLTPQGQMPQRRARLLFCKLDKMTSSAYEREVTKTRAFDTYFNEIEDACPRNFDPIRSQSIRQNSQYMRSYFNSATALYFENGAFYATGYRALGSVLVAKPDPEKKRLLNLNCPKEIELRYLK